jgi:hypothetical protein
MHHYSTAWTKHVNTQAHTWNVLSASKVPLPNCHQRISSSPGKNPTFCKHTCTKHTHTAAKHQQISFDRMGDIN